MFITNILAPLSLKKTQFEKGGKGVRIRIKLAAAKMCVFQVCMRSDICQKIEGV